MSAAGVCHRPQDSYLCFLLVARPQLHERAVGIAVQHHAADGLEMRLARLDLLRQRMDVAEAALERRAEEDRPSAGGLVEPVGCLLGDMDGLRAAQPPPGAVRRAA